MTGCKVLMGQFQRALIRLDEVLMQEPNDFMRDSAVQRFEFVFDLAWKSIKAHLHEVHGVVCASPKKCFREAYRLGIIEYDQIWLQATDDRNEIAHMYKEELAQELYQKLPSYLKCFQALARVLSQPIAKN